MALNQMAQFVQQNQRACGPRARPKGAHVGRKLTGQIFAPLVKSTIDVYDAIIKETVRRVRWPIVDQSWPAFHLKGHLTHERSWPYERYETIEYGCRREWPTIKTATRIFFAKN